MAGFQLNLKKRNGDQKDATVKKPKMSFGLRKPPIPPENTAPNGFADDSDDENTTVLIDSFNQKKGGALAGTNAVNNKSVAPLVITPKKLNTTIRKDVYTPNKEQDESEVIAAEEQEKKSRLKFGLTHFSRNQFASSQKPKPAPEAKRLSTEEQIRTSLLNGEQFHEANGLVIPIDSSNRNLDDSDDDPADYDKVPVEQFGAALLRGMGWKPKAPTKSKAEINDPLQKRQRGMLLGIGAKPVGSDLIEDLRGKKGTVLQAPLLKREKASGKIIENG